MRFTADLPSVYLEDFDTFFRSMWRALAVKNPVLNDNGELTGYVVPGAYAELQSVDFNRTGRLYALVLDGEILLTIAVAHYNRANLFVDVTEPGLNDPYFFPNVVQWLKDKFAAQEIRRRIEAPLAFDILINATPPKGASVEIEEQHVIGVEESNPDTDMTEEELWWMERIKQGKESGNIARYCDDRDIPRSSWYVWEKRLENHPKMVKSLKKYM
jgi:hypothetical protein